MSENLFVAAHSEVHFLELEFLFVQFRSGKIAGVFPSRHICELFIVSSGLAVFKLMLDTEVASAALLSIQCVLTKKFSELQKVSHTACLLEFLI